MPSGKNIYKVLAAGANDKTFALLQTLLPGSSYEPPMRAGSAGEAKRMAMDCNLDIAILNAPMRDEFGRFSSMGVLLVMRLRVLYDFKKKMSIEKKIGIHGTSPIDCQRVSQEL